MSITLATVVGTIATAVVLFATRAKPGSREHKLVHRSDQPHIDLGDLPAHCKLRTGGNFVVRTFRQSQNLHQEDRFFSSPETALKAAMATFKRAKINHVAVMDSTEMEFSFQRSFPDFSGRNEGRKIRWIEIHRIQPETKLENDG
jgi:hypothetical protein